MSNYRWIGGGKMNEEKKLSVYNIVNNVTNEILDKKMPLNLENVRNGYEAYGIITKKYNEIQSASKKIKENMGSLLSSLDDVEKGDLYAFMENVKKLAESITSSVVKNIDFNAEIKRIIRDLEDEDYSASPIEKYIKDEENKEDKND